MAEDTAADSDQGLAATLSLTDDTLCSVDDVSLVKTDEVPDGIFSSTIIDYSRFSCPVKGRSHSSERLIVHQSIFSSSTSCKARRIWSYRHGACFFFVLDSGFVTDCMNEEQSFINQWETLQ